MTAIGQGTFPAMTSGVGIASQNYLAAARYFFLGAKALSKDGPDVAPACAFLAAQSLECTLKSFLSKSGFSKTALKDSSPRHNLEVLWKEASSRSQIFSGDPPEWCVILNQTHKSPFHLRYPVGINGFQTPEVVSMVSNLGSLLTQVEAGAFV